MVLLIEDRREGVEVESEVGRGVGRAGGGARWVGWGGGGSGRAGFGRVRLHV